MTNDQCQTSQGARILYCHCAHADVVPQATKDAVLARLQEAGAAFEAVTDLCGLAARRDPALKRLAESARLRIAACYPRAVKWLFACAGAPLDEGRVDFLNMRTESAEAVLGGLLGAGEAPKGAQVPLDPEETGEWIPWFPVIDRDRCSNCKQCLNFCLFGVYGVDGDGSVVVKNPANCKTYCPACSRICPEVAIIFPKYKSSPINGGEVSAEDAQREKVKVNPAELLRGDVYATLRKRTQRFPAERDEERAIEERRKCACMSKLQEQLDIPPEVLASLARKGSGTGHLCGCDCDPASGTADGECGCDCSSDDKDADGCRE